MKHGILQHLPDKTQCRSRSRRVASIQFFLRQERYTTSNMFNVMSTKSWLKKACDDQQPHLWFLTCHVEWPVYVGEQNAIPPNCLDVWCVLLWLGYWLALKVTDKKKTRTEWFILKKIHFEKGKWGNHTCNVLCHHFILPAENTSKISSALAVFFNVSINMT